VPARFLDLAARQRGFGERAIDLMALEVLLIGALAPDRRTHGARRLELA
jgi:hypothetical protein